MADSIPSISSALSVSALHCPSVRGADTYSLGAANSDIETVTDEFEESKADPGSGVACANALTRDNKRAMLSTALFKMGEQDRNAFRVVYTLTSTKLFGICLRICGERTAAEDVLHEVYLTVWKRAGSWEPGRSSPITWLATIARNRAIDWRRSRGGQVLASINEIVEPIDPAPDPEHEVMRSQRALHIQSCLDRLDSKQAEAIRTAFFHGLTYRELARRDGMPLGTMKSIIRHGLAQLKLELSAAPE